MKACKTCKLDKDESLFSSSQLKLTNGRCRECQAELVKAHYQKNKTTYQERDAKRRAKYKDFISKFKDVPCKDCGKKYPPYVMDFDHLDPTIKSFTIGKAASKCVNLEEIIQEINKCEVVCANCHRERTFNRIRG